MSQDDFRELQDLADAYLEDVLDAPGLQRLEKLLRADEASRGWFVRYCRLHTDLHLHLRAQRAGRIALEAIGRKTTRAPRRRWIIAVLALAACLLLAIGLTWSLARRTAPQPEARIAWLANAQNVHWSGNEEAVGDLCAGRVVALDSGLAEIRFACGAALVLEGPARLELISDRSVRLLNGRLAARVPEPARGFQVFTPIGRVVDLGTEFGISVADDGASDVHVFAGKVEAYAGASKLDLTDRQSARIDPGTVTRVQEPGEGARTIRTILPPPQFLPRTLKLDFTRPVDSSLRDSAGQGTGLTRRLPGTGQDLSQNDPNLRLNPAAGCLELTTTNSDINTQLLLGQGEYLGVRLSDLGFTGVEDFEVTVVVPDIPALQRIGQFGLYAGTRSDHVIRGGLISREEPERYGQFLVNNLGGRDSDLSVVGLLSSGDTLRLILSRKDNRYALSVENQTTGSTSTLNIRHPAFLDSAGDLHVGFFGANTQSDVRRTLVIRELTVTVWAKSASSFTTGR